MIVIINNIIIQIGTSVCKSCYAILIKRTIRSIVIAKQFECIEVEFEVLAFIFMELTIVNGLIVITCRIELAPPVTGFSAVVGWLEFVLNICRQSIVFSFTYQLVHDMVVAFTDEHSGDTDVGILEMGLVIRRKTVKGPFRNG